MSAGFSTINTVLKIGTNSSLTKITEIKSYPSLFGQPGALETTDLEDTEQTFVPGVKSMDTMTFTCNWDKTKFSSLKALEGSTQSFELDFGASGAQGKFTWQGMLTMSVNEGSVNGIREMTINVFPSTGITFA